MEVNRNFIYARYSVIPFRRIFKGMLQMFNIETYGCTEILVCWTYPCINHDCLTLFPPSSPTHLLVALHFEESFYFFLSKDSQWIATHDKISQQIKHNAKEENKDAVAVTTKGTQNKIVMALSTCNF